MQKPLERKLRRTEANYDDNLPGFQEEARNGGRHANVAQKGLQGDPG